MRLWFGKHKGEDIMDVPLQYLKWMEEEFSDLTEDQREEINHEIERREGDRSSMGRVVKKQTRRGFE